ncbi:hypothetical protein D9M70_597000 [compost metagenome]
MQIGDLLVGGRDVVKRAPNVAKHPARLQHRICLKKQFSRLLARAAALAGRVGIGIGRIGAATPCVCFDSVGPFLDLSLRAKSLERRSFHNGSFGMIIRV